MNRGQIFIINCSEWEGRTCCNTLKGIIFVKTGGLLLKGFFPLTLPNSSSSVKSQSSAAWAGWMCTSGTVTRSWIIPEAEHLLPMTQGNIWVVRWPRAQSCHLTEKTNIVTWITFVFPLKYILFACAGYFLVLSSLAFFSCSSNINSWNNFSQGIHSAKRKTNITVEQEFSAVCLAVDEGFALFSFCGCKDCSRVWHTAGHFPVFCCFQWKVSGFKFFLRLLRVLLLILNNFVLSCLIYFIAKQIFETGCYQGRLRDCFRFSQFLHP